MVFLKEAKGIFYKALLTTKKYLNIVGKLDNWKNGFIPSFSNSHALLHLQLQTLLLIKMCCKGIYIIHKVVFIFGWR